MDENPSMAHAVCKITHELNGHLTTVLGHVELLHLRLDDSGLKRHTEQIREAAKGAAHLTKLLQELARDCRS